MADVEMAFGSYYWSGNTTASANDAATPIKCAGTTTAQLTNNFTHTTNRLQYTGATTLYFQVTVTVSLTATAATDPGTIHIYKGTSAIAGGSIERKMPITDQGAVASTCLVQLAQNDYIELWCESEGADIAITDGCVAVTMVG